jgi:uncharacterized membrane protein YkvA (DUF1232 family)
MSDNQQDNSNRLNKLLARRKNDPGFWREVWQQIQLVYRLVRDPHVPIYLKLLPFLSLAYLFFPFDLIPDMLPLLGQADDLAIMVTLSKIFIQLSPKDVVSSHLAQIREDGPVVIEQPPDEKDPLADAIVIKGQHKAKSGSDGGG